MPLVLHSDVEVAETPAHVWATLTDLDAYPAWNPFILEARGTLVPGSRLRLRMQPVDGRVTTLQPRLVDVDVERRLRWKGRFIVPGLLDAEHDFVLEPTADGTRLTQQETFRGLLVPFVASMLRRSTLPAFELMNAALRDRVEGTVRQRA